MEEKKHHESDKEYFNHTTLLLIGLISVLLIFNQIQIQLVSASLNGAGSVSFASKKITGKVDLKNVDIPSIKSTAQGIAALFPIAKIKTTEDAIAIMIPTGTPEYGNSMGVSFDEPIKSMEAMANAYPALKKQAQEKPEVWQRYLNLAAAPRGIACEFCCGVGAQGIDSKGDLRCGCQHNPAVQTITLWLMLNTDYTDAEILKEVYKWKSLFFPKNMVELATQIAGGDSSVLKDLPGMVGGC
ncbi:hypothetical protein HYX01_01780 [Candidatus Woesearchaeota archaeon]|nr:hypothetical protein [Candidatus Woesearchaeota archaeon]